jgi:hypothetical protein
MEKDFGNMKTTVPLNTASSDNGEAGMGLHPAETVQHDAVFGEVTKEGPNYRGVSLPGPSKYLPLIQTADTIGCSWVGSQQSLSC